jgi:hypothetical protein
MERARRDHCRPLQTTGDHWRDRAIVLLGFITLHDIIFLVSP